MEYVYKNVDGLNVDKSKIIVVGDSAGGNYASLATHRDPNDKTNMIAMQALLYPAVLISTTAGIKDYIFSLNDYTQKEFIISAINAIASDNANLPTHYVEDLSLHTSKDTSALRDSNFDGLAKTLIICAEFDFLTAQSKTYARRLAQARVDKLLYFIKVYQHVLLWIRLDIFPRPKIAFQRSLNILELYKI